MRIGRIVMWTAALALTSWRAGGMCYAQAAGPAGKDCIWIEGEDAVQHSMQRHGWYDSVKKDNLSGGEWLSHFAVGTPPVA